MVFERAVDLWQIARAAGGDLALLDNPVTPSRLGSWTYLALGQVDEFRVGHGAQGDPLEEFEHWLERGASAPSGEQPFSSGVVGYLSYELLHSIEPAVEPSSAPRPAGELIHFVRPAIVIAMDTEFGRTHAWAVNDDAMRRAAGLVEAAPERAVLEIPPRRSGEFGVDELRASGLEPVTDPAAYLVQVERACDEIAAGRFFELCLTQEYRGEFAGEGTALYERLRAANPAPMGAFIRDGDLEVLCTSPERFVSVSAAGTVETRPIKGTRQRSSDPTADRHLREALLSSPKDRAENTMIVDLARNDIGRVCMPGSVEVPELCVVESYANVHHLVSTVRGHLRAGAGPVDVIRACFPGGSMTGAPKVEAMRAIAEFEQSQRGIFSGAIGWIGDDGAMDLNIVIRTLIKQGEQLSLHTGGAITSDSDPDAEYAETMDKARPIADALRAAAAARTVEA